MRQERSRLRVLISFDAATPYALRGALIDTLSMMPLCDAMLIRYAAAATAIHYAATIYVTLCLRRMLAAVTRYEQMMMPHAMRVAGHDVHDDIDAA